VCAGTVLHFLTKRSARTALLYLISCFFIEREGLYCGLFTKKYGLIFKGSAASAPTHSPRHLHARPSASLMFRARDFLALRASIEITKRLLDKNF
jgi:hypothetical protein